MPLKELRNIYLWMIYLMNDLGNRKNNYWCHQHDWITEEKVNINKKYRCSVCGRRLKPEIVWHNWTTGEIEGFRLPPHKPQGYKIKKKKRKKS